MIHKLFQKLYRGFNCRLIRKITLDKMNNELAEALSRCRDMKLLESVDQTTRSECLAYLEVSKSQLRQDLFVLSELNFKKNGFFIEFGATNGIKFSNTWLL